MAKTYVRQPSHLREALDIAKDVTIRSNEVPPTTPSGTVPAPR